MTRDQKHWSGLSGLKKEFFSQRNSHFVSGIGSTNHVRSNRSDHTDPHGDPHMSRMVIHPQAEHVITSVPIAPLSCPSISPSPSPPVQPHLDPIPNSPSTYPPIKRDPTWPLRRRNLRYRSPCNSPSEACPVRSLLCLAFPASSERSRSNLPSNFVNLRCGFVLPCILRFPAQVWPQPASYSLSTSSRHACNSLLQPA